MQQNRDWWKYRHYVAIVSTEYDAHLFKSGLDCTHVCTPGVDIIWINSYTISLNLNTL